MANKDALLFGLPAKGNNKSIALDWNKYYVIRCSNCKECGEWPVGHCQLDGSFRCYSSRCKKFEPKDEFEGKTGVLDEGSRRFPKYVLPNEEVVVEW
jgi:hypothetical protein